MGSWVQIGIGLGWDVKGCDVDDFACFLLHEVGYRLRLSSLACRSSSSALPPPPPPPPPRPPLPTASATRPSETTFFWRPEGVSPNYFEKD